MKLLLGLVPKELILEPFASAIATLDEDELREIGVNIVIYANHLLRSAFPAMQRTAESILKNKRSLEVDDLCMPIKKIITQTH